MKNRNIIWMVALLGLSLSACEKKPAVDFNNIFSMPRTPHTLISPGQEYTMTVPAGKKVVITDVYIENLGGGSSHVVILEQKSPNGFEVRYAYNTQENNVTVVNYTTGLRLGDLSPIAGSIKVQNINSSKGRVLARINGYFVD